MNPISAHESQCVICYVKETRIKRLTYFMITFIQYYGKRNYEIENRSKIGRGWDKRGAHSKGAPNGFLSDDGYVLNLDTMNIPVLTQTKHQK